MALLFSYSGNRPQIVFISFFFHFILAYQILRYPHTMSTTKAVILVGGSSRGTRFRPLALDCAKILFPVAGKSLLLHTVDSVLKIPSIKEILLIGFYDASVFSDFISQFNTRMKYSKRKCQMKYLKEFKALGTAGGLYHFREEILRGSPENFLVIHGDIVCAFPLQQMVDFYETKKEQNNGKDPDAVMFGVKLTDYDLYLALNASDQSSFGTIVSDEGTSKVVHYVEKPESKISDVINGGIYLFNDNLFRKLSHAKITKITIANDITNAEFVDEDIISMEKDILRNLPELGNTYVYEYKGFWKAIKTPADALWANELYLDLNYQSEEGVKARIHGKSHNRSPTVDQIVLERPSVNIRPPVFIHPTATVNYNDGTKIGPYVSVGENCVIGPGTRISNSIILDNCEVGKNAFIINSIISFNCKIGNWSRIQGTGLNLVSINELIRKNGSSKLRSLLATNENFKVIGIKDSGNISLLGSGTQVTDETFVLNSFILPSKSIKSDVKYEIIM